MKPYFPFLTLALASSLLAQETKIATPDLGDLILDPKLQGTTLESIEQKFIFQLNEQEQQRLAAIRKHLEKEGKDPSQYSDKAFAWLTANKDGLRANAGTLKLWDKTVGEVVINGAGGNFANISISLYNRGDDGFKQPHQLVEMYEEWKTIMEQKTGVRGENRKATAAVPVTATQWRKGDTAFLLEASISKINREQRAEFLRIRVASVSAASGAKITGRSTLKNNVVTKDDGDVYINNVPMVDQGQKGYCAVASIARIASYYGLTADQHEIAQLANTTSLGTNPVEMEEAFKDIVGKLNIRTTQHYEFSQRQFDADVRAYNQLAKKQGKQVFEAPKGHVLIPDGVWDRMDPELFAAVKAKQSGCKRFMSKVTDYVDQGIPLAWCLRLGMFKEQDIPQQTGGHMRLIIGYNEEKQEIIYTDSWGKGHEYKKMPLSQAYATSMCLYTMAPTR